MPIQIRTPATMAQQQLEERCAICHYGLGILDSTGDVFCRRYPPALLCTSEDKLAVHFPRMGGAGWCGEFKRKLILSQ